MTTTMTQVATTTTRGMWPAGCRVMVTGHRDIRGPQEDVLRPVIIRILESLRARHPEGLVGVSGMAVGADTLFNESLFALGIPLVAALPVANQDSIWPQHARVKYREHLARAAMIVNVWELPEYAASTFSAQMHARNYWMLDQVATGDGVVLALWDGREVGGTWAAVSAALRRDRRVLVLDPRTAVSRVIRPPIKRETGVFELFGHKSSND